MSEMNAEQKVKAVYPEAYAELSPIHAFRIFSQRVSIPYKTKRLDSGLFVSEQDAWQNAASRLPAQPEPVITHPEPFPTWEEVKSATSPDPSAPWPLGAPTDEETALWDLVSRFAEALRDKLFASERKYAWNGGWRKDDWVDDLRRDLQKHVEKGDPRDVAAYCAFAWHHGWSLSPQLEPQPTLAVEDAVREMHTCARALLGWTDETGQVRNTDGSRRQVKLLRAALANYEARTGEGR